MRTNFPFRSICFGTVSLGIILVLLFGCRVSQSELTLPAEVHPSQQAAPTTPSTIRPSTTVAFSTPEAASSPTVEAGSAILNQSSPTPGWKFLWTATPDARISPRYWRQYPVIPALSARAKEILSKGISNGNDVHAFSVIGDCQSMPPVFMGIFDQPGSYQLGADSLYLKETIDHFAGSFALERVTVQNGFSVATVFSPLWADRDYCLSNETPLECELRKHKPIVVFINLGTNWQLAGDLSHEDYLRRIVDFAIERGVLPILSTKADNIEGDHSINESIAQVAYDYDIPLWNFWRAVQNLPHHGLADNRDANYLSIEAWDVRSYSGLKMLHSVLIEIKLLLNPSSE
jgi:hypothetical protein